MTAPNIGRGVSANRYAGWRGWARGIWHMLLTMIAISIVRVAIGVVLGLSLGAHSTADAWVADLTDSLCSIAVGWWMRVLVEADA